ncbi:hypothetical protein [Microvirga sp. TS319]|uniref:hypothetical protein n=1 Tax=Microvirga sp. TS319 TaxID=3241165 RepID=UPI00351AA74E
MNLRHFEPTNTSTAMMDADEIEQRIIRAYVQLACTEQDTGGSRTVSVTRLGHLEIRLTEVPARDLPPDMPLFWMEVYSQADRSVIDSCGLFEFDEQELATAVEMIAGASRQSRSIH